MTSPPSDRGIGAVEPLWCPMFSSLFLFFSQATLSRWRRERVEPPIVQVGGVYRYNPVNVRAWVSEQEAAPG